MNLNVCSADNDKGIAKVGWLFAFFGDGTDCRCCLGMRIVLAFILGLLMGLVAMYDWRISLAITVTFIVSSLLYFTIWWLIQNDEDDELEYSTDE